MAMPNPPLGRDKGFVASLDSVEDVDSFPEIDNKGCDGGLEGGGIDGGRGGSFDNKGGGLTEGGGGGNLVNGGRK